jgi:3-methyladenine DNA glycosylase Tag
MTAAARQVDGELIVNAPRSLRYLPVETILSSTLSKDLVERGLRSRWAEDCCAFIQSVDVCLEHEDVSVFHKLLRQRFLC